MPSGAAGPSRGRQRREGTSGAVSVAEPLSAPKIRPNSPGDCTTPEQQLEYPPMLGCDGEPHGASWLADQSETRPRPFDSAERTSPSASVTVNASPGCSPGRSGPWHPCAATPRRDRARCRGWRRSAGAGRTRRRGRPRRPPASARPSTRGRPEVHRHEVDAGQRDAPVQHRVDDAFGDEEHARSRHRQGEPDLDRPPRAAFAWSHRSAAT